MGQVLRVTVGGADYTFKLLGINIDDRQNPVLEVEWAGETVRIVRSGQRWTRAGSEQAGPDQVSESIGKALALRYRF